jgi:hypothetical protein
MVHLASPGTEAKATGKGEIASYHCPEMTSSFSGPEIIGSYTIG